MSKFIHLNSNSSAVSNLFIRKDHITSVYIERDMHTSKYYVMVACNNEFIYRLEGVNGKEEAHILLHRILNEVCQ